MALTTKVNLALPTAMLDDLDRLAKREHRTRTDLIREAARRYLQADTDRIARNLAGIQMREGQCESTSTAKLTQA